MSVVLHPLWCIADGSCTINEPGGEHRGPLEIIETPSGGSIEVELSERADGIAVLAMREWSRGHTVQPLVEWRIPLNLAGAVIHHAYGMLESVDAIMFVVGRQAGDD